MFCTSVHMKCSDQCSGDGSPYLNSGSPDNGWSGVFSGLINGFFW